MRLDAHAVDPDAVRLEHLDQPDDAGEFGGTPAIELIVIQFGTGRDGIEMLEQQIPRLRIPVAEMVWADGGSDQEAVGIGVLEGDVRGGPGLVGASLQQNQE